MMSRRCSKWSSILAARSLLACLAVLAVTSVARLSVAAPEGPDALPVAVVAVKSDDALDQAEALTQALRNAVRDSQGWALGDTSQSLEFLVVKMNCPEPIDASCEARIADVIKADRYLWSVIQFEDKSKQTVVGTLNFWVRGKGTTRHELRYSANLTDPNDDALIDLATSAVDQVTGGAPKGGVRISTGGIAGQLFVDDNPLGAIPAEGAEYQLPAGEHRIAVKAPGYETAETTVLVKPATTVETSLTLVEKEEEEPIDGRMIGGFVALGAGVAAGAVGLWAALDVNSINDDAAYQEFRQKVATSQDACEVARNQGPHPPGTPAIAPGEYAAVVDQCDRADTRTIVQAVMFPVAAVAAGVGIYLLGTSSLVAGEEEADAVEALIVEPVVGPDAQALIVTYRF